MSTLTNAHALIIGIANYRAVNPLPATVLNDARGVYDLLVDPQRGGYDPANVQCLLDGKATLAALRAGLAELAQRCDSDSTAFVFYSGHGARLTSGPSAGEYLMPVDASMASTAALAGMALSGQEFTEALRRILARKVLVIFDCCHAGGIGQAKDAQGPALKAGLSESYYEALGSGRGRAILASSRDSEFSYVLGGASNSLFTQHLLAGLHGGIATDDGVLVATFLRDSFRVNEPKTVSEIRDAVVEGGLRRVRPAMMTTATTILALLPVLTSTGRGSDIMVPMAIPSFGGMLIQVITMFTVPVLYSWWKEMRLDSGK